MKWGIDNAFKKTSRVGPSYTMRPFADYLGKKNRGTDVLLPLNVFKAFDATKKVGPSFSLGALPKVVELGSGQGPGQYDIKSTMDPKGNPLYPKHGGVKMGTSVLTCVDDGTPAPGQYSLDAFEKSARIIKKPAYTIQGREAWIDRAAAPDPGPGEYQYEKCKRNGKITPFKYSMASKLEQEGPARGSSRYVHAGPIYDCPGVPGVRSGVQHCATFKPPDYGFAKMPRGLL